MAIAGYTRVCGKSTTGNLKFWVSEVTNVTSIAITGNEISTFTASASIFHRTQAALDTLARSEKAEGGKQGYKFTHEIKASFPKPSTLLKTYIEALENASPCGIAVVILDGNGQAWLLGYNLTDKSDRGMYLTNASMDSGLMPGEDGKQDWDITLTGISSEHALPFNSTINATIVSEAATWLSTT